MSKQTLTNSTRSMDRSPERVVAQKIRDVAADIENFGTNNGKRQLDERWARGAIDRARKDLLKTYLPGKQYGVMASAKVAVSKAESLDDLRKAADKLESFQSKPDQENKPKKTAAKQNLSVPPGWKLVPIEPTVPMVVLAAESLCCEFDPHTVGPQAKFMLAVYREFLAAAPEPEQQVEPVAEVLS